MNQRTTKQIRRNTRDQYAYQHAKKAWNKLPRPQRYANRQAMTR